MAHDYLPPKLVFYSARNFLNARTTSPATVSERRLDVSAVFLERVPAIIFCIVSGVPAPPRQDAYQATRQVASAAAGAGTQRGALRLPRYRRPAGGLCWWALAQARSFSAHSASAPTLAPRLLLRQNPHSSSPFITDIILRYSALVPFPAYSHISSSRTILLRWEPGRPGQSGSVRAVSRARSQRRGLYQPRARDDAQLPSLHRCAFRHEQPCRTTSPTCHSSVNMHPYMPAEPYDVYGDLHPQSSSLVP